LAYDSKRNSIKAWPYGIFPIEELKKNFPSHNYYIEKGSDFYIIPGISEESLSLGEESSVGDLSLTDDPRGQLSKSDNKDGATSFTDEDKKDQEK
jgi:hypothetical protein